MTGLIVICGALAVGLVLVIHGTLVKNRWGINLARCRALVAMRCDHFRDANLLGCATALHCRTADGAPVEPQSIISRC
jgi:hypothetical protein